MASIYGDFEAQICRNVGNRIDVDTKAMILSNTNKMISVMMTLHEWEDLQEISDTTLLTGVATYSLAMLGVENLHKLYSITLYDGTRWLPPMTRYPYFQWERDVKPVQGFISARPGCYTMIGDKYIEFSCPAAMNYPIRIFYYGHASSVPTLPDDITPDPTFELPYEDVELVMEAIVTAYCWLDLQDLEMSKTWFDIAKSLADTHIKEARQILNFDVVTRRAVPVVGTPWADPFVRSVR